MMSNQTANIIGAFYRALIVAAGYGSRRADIAYYTADTVGIGGDITGIGTARYSCTAADNTANMSSTLYRTVVCTRGNGSVIIADYAADAGFRTADGSCVTTLGNRTAAAANNAADILVTADRTGVFAFGNFCGVIITDNTAHIVLLAAIGAHLA